MAKLSLTNNNPPKESKPVKPGSIQHMLEQIDLSQPFSTGSEAVTYHFPQGSGLEHYLLRIERPDPKIEPADLTWKELLMGSTSLTPVKHIARGIDGQPLMMLNKNPDIKILPILSGAPLVSPDLADSTRVTAANFKLDAMWSLLSYYDVNDKNPLTPLFDIGYRLASLGYEQDFTLGNILYDAKTGQLGLIDQTPETRKYLSEPSPIRAKMGVQRAFNTLVLQQLSFGGDFDVNDTLKKTQLYAAYQEVYAKFKTMAEDARDEVVTKYQTHPELLSDKNHVGFATLFNTKAVSLKKPPELLVERLNEIGNEAGLSR